MDHATTVAATVHREADGRWMLSLESSTTEVIETVPTGWGGTGRFYDEGLNYVAPLLRERGLAYTQPWTQDGERYSVVVHQPAPWRH